MIQSFPGYDAMGDWKMSKPDLRAGLEADLKLVCDGRKTKEEVRLFLRLRNVLNNFYLRCCTLRWRGTSRCSREQSTQ